MGTINRSADVPICPLAVTPVFAQAGGWGWPREFERTRAGLIDDLPSRGRSGLAQPDIPAVTVGVSAVGVRRVSPTAPRPRLADQH